MSLPGLMAVHDFMKREAERIFSLAGVQGFSEWYQWKITDGRQTDVMAIRFYVDRKRPRWACWLRGSLIPKTILGVATDVFEVGRLEFQQDPHRQRHEILQGGMSYMHKDGGDATLGIILEDQDSGQAYMVSNTHVIYNVDNPGGECSQEGDPQLQPGRISGGEDPGDRVSIGDLYIPLVGQLPGEIADAARAKWNGRRDVLRASTLHGGPLKGVKAPSVGMKLKGCSRNGDFTVNVRDIAASVRVGGLGCKKHDRFAILRKQVIYAPGLGPGSSGTVIYSEDGYAVVINSFGSGGPGSGSGGGGWFAEIMRPLRLKWPGEGPPPPPPPREGELEYSVDGGAWERAKTVQLRGLAQQPPPGEAKLRVRLDDRDVGQGKRVEAEAV